MVQLAGVQSLVHRAAGDPKMQPVGPMHQAVDVHARRGHPERRNGAAVELPEHRSVRQRANVERLVPPAIAAEARKPSPQVVQQRRIAQGDTGGILPDPRLMRQRGGKIRQHPPDLAVAEPERHAISGQVRRLAGVNVPQESRLAHAIAFQTRRHHATSP